MAPNEAPPPPQTPPALSESCVDAVTALPNRRMLTKVLDRALTGARAHKRQLAVVWLNLDRFRDVNHALGHEIGDALLCAVGQRLQESVRVNDLVAHAGGDDFVLVLPRVASQAHLLRLARRVQAVFDQPFVVGSESILLTASCGVAVHPLCPSGPRDLVDCAHTAMRGAKDLGGGCSRIYEAEDIAATPRVHLLREIHEGLVGGQFTLFYQPQVDLATMHVPAAEALVRWRHPTRGLLLPGEFVGFAEETGMIVPLGRRVLEMACRDHAAWQTLLPNPPRLAVNVSAREFQRTDVCGQVRAAAKAAGVAVSQLEVEITETAVLADPRHAAEVATGLRKAGASVALDDFGTGYSSLMHLREIPVDRIKVDRSFVTSCLEDRSASAILIGVISIAHELGIRVVAEGVETRAQLDFVRAVGCDAAQGHYLARPMPHEEFVEFVLREAGAGAEAHEDALSGAHEDAGAPEREPVVPGLDAR
jgi:diguanylate cyclase (GGDEF)-like protein